MTFSPETEDGLESEAFVRALFANHPETPPDPDLAEQSATSARRRRWAGFGAAALALVVVLAGTVALTQRPDERDRSTPAASPHGQLTDQQYAAAVAIARQEIDRDPATVTSATVTLRPGTEPQPNTGPPCESGNLLIIQLIGNFPIAVGGPPGGAGPVTAVVLTADAESGRTCLLTVQTGDRSPEPGSVALDLG